MRVSALISIGSRLRESNATARRAESKENIGGLFLPMLPILCCDLRRLH